MRVGSNCEAERNNDRATDGREPPDLETRGLVARERLLGRLDGRHCAQHVRRAREALRKRAALVERPLSLGAVAADIVYDLTEERRRKRG